MQRGRTGLTSLLFRCYCTTQPTIPTELVIPIFKNGYWNKPKLSSMQIANIKKQTLGGIWDFKKFLFIFIILF